MNEFAVGRQFLAHWAVSSAKVALCDVHHKIALTGLEPLPVLLSSRRPSTPAAS